MEQWKPIPGYEGYYQVSNEGRVKTLSRYNLKNQLLPERILKAPLDRGYPRVLFYKNKKRKHFSVHRLVAQAFIPNPEKKPQVNHINEDKTDNRVENLEWATSKENNNHGTRTERQAKTRRRLIKQLTQTGEVIKIWGGLRVASRSLGASPGLISQAANGQRPTAYGYKWCYED